MVVLALLWARSVTLTKLSYSMVWACSLLRQEVRWPGLRSAFASLTCSSLATPRVMLRPTASPPGAERQSLRPHPGPAESVVQSLSRVWFFATPWTAARQTSLSFTVSETFSNSCPLSQWCHPIRIESEPTFNNLPRQFFQTLHLRGLPQECHLPGVSSECMLSPFSCVRLSVTPWTIVCRGPLSMGFSRQEYRSGLPFPSPSCEYWAPCFKSEAFGDFNSWAAELSLWLN